MTRQNLTVAVVGATGVVGRTMIQVLLEREFPVGELRLLASERSAGQTISIDGATHEIQLATGEAFDGVDIALFSAGGDASRELAPLAVARGATVIDNIRLADGPARSRSSSARSTRTTSRAIRGSSPTRTARRCSSCPS